MHPLSPDLRTHPDVGTKKPILCHHNCFSTRISHRLEWHKIQLIVLKRLVMGVGRPPVYVSLRQGRAPPPPPFLTDTFCHLRLLFDLKTCFSHADSLDSTPNNFPLPDFLHTCLPTCLLACLLTCLLVITCLLAYLTEHPQTRFGATCFTEVQLCESGATNAPTDAPSNAPSNASSNAPSSTGTYTL